MKKIFTIAIAAMLCGFMGVEAKTANQLRVYINPGHGSWGPNDRPQNILREVNGVKTVVNHGSSTAAKCYPDTTAFFESNTNLWKCFGIFEALKQMGLTFDPTKNQSNTDQWRRGAGLDLSNNIVFSRVKSGPYPVVKINTSGDYEAERDCNRELSVIAAEAENNNFDMFISVHSNALSADNDKINRPGFYFRGPSTSITSTNVPDATERSIMQASINMSKAAWTHCYANSNANWTNTNLYSLTKSNLVASWNSSTGTAAMGVLKHHVPGYLSEGYFHTYQPARHRAMNPDVCAMEGYAYAYGLADYFGIAKPSTGNIYGIVRDANVQFEDNLYHAMTSSNASNFQSLEDIYKPLNGAIVTLRQGNTVVATYTTDNHYNGAYVFRNVAPGTYTVTVTHPNYTTKNSLTATVVAGDITYPANLYINGTGSVALEDGDIPSIPGPANPGDMSLDFVTDYKDVQCSALAGKKIRRVLPADKDNYYILAHDANDVPTLYRYNVPAKTATSISISGIEDGHPQPSMTTTEYSSMTTRDVTDIALTSDGYLVAINGGTRDGKNGDTSTKMVQIYYWQNSGGYATGNPISMGGTNSAGNLYYSSFAKSMTYSGTINNGTLYFFVRSDSQGNTHGMRFEAITISNKTVGTSKRSNWGSMSGAPTDEDLGDFQLSPSPFSGISFLMTSQNQAPKAIVGASTNGGNPSIAATMASGNFTGYLGFRSGFTSLSGTQYMVSPLDAAAQNLRIFNITSGLGSPSTLTASGTTLGTLPASAPSKVVSWVEADQGVAHVSPFIDSSNPAEPAFHILVVRGNGLVSHLVNEYQHEEPYDPETWTSFDFDQHFVDRQVSELTGLNIRRMIALKDDEFYVLGFDSSDAPHIFVYNVNTDKIVKTVILPTDNNSGDSHIRDISDIALTDDGKLVAISAENQGFQGSSNIHVWYWTNGKAGRANDDPILLGTTNYNGYWNDGLCGKSMAFSGTLDNGTLIYSATTAGTSKNTRWARLTIANKAIASTFCGNELPAGLINDNELQDFQITKSPWTPGRFLLTCQRQNPREIEFSSTDRQGCTVTAAMPAGYISSHKGFRGSIMHVDDRIYFLAPQDENASEIRIVDVTEGLDKPHAVEATGNLLGSVRQSARKRVPWLEATAGTANVCGIANTSDPDQPIVNIFAVRGNGLVSHLTNYYEFDDEVGQNPYASSLDFNQNFADNSVKPITGKNVRRIVANDNAAYVLAFEKDDDNRYTIPTIAVYDIHRQRPIGTLSIPANDSHYRNIGDIALDEQGNLVGVNASRQALGGDNDVHFYYWKTNNKGVASGNPIGMGAMNKAGEWANSDFGCSMAFRGSVDDGMFYVFNTNAADSRLRFEMVPAKDKRIDAAQSSYNTLPAAYTDATFGDYQVSVSPLHERGIVVTSTNMLPVEFKVNASSGEECTIYSTLKDGMVSDNGFRAGVFKVNGRSYLVEPQGNAKGLNTGLNIIDITDGLSAAKDISTNMMVTATKAPRKKMPWEEEDPGVPLAYGYATSGSDHDYLNLCLLRSSGMLSHFSTDPNFYVDNEADMPNYFAYGLGYSPQATGDFSVAFNSTGDVSTGKVTLTNITDANDVVEVPLATVSEGENVVDINPTALQPNANYKWEVSLDNKAVASSMLIAATPITRPDGIDGDCATLNNLTSTSGYTRGGVVVFTDPQYPASYGMTAVSYGRAIGIELYDATGQRVGIYHANEPQMNASNAASLFRGTQRAGKAIFTDWSDFGAGYWQFDPANPEAPLVNLLEGTKDSDGVYTYNGNAIGGGATGISFYGSGADEKCYVFCEDFPAKNSNKLVRYDIAGAPTFAAAPTICPITNPSGYVIPWATYSLDVYAIEEGVFLSQYRSGSNARNEPGFVFASHDGNVLFNSADLPEFPSDGSTGIGAGLALSLDKKTLAVSNSQSAILIYDVEWNGNVPSLSYRNTIPATHKISNGGGSHIQMRFDPAGNLAVFTNAVGYELYSVPQEESVATTPAPAGLYVSRALLTGVEDVMHDPEDGDAPVEYFNTQGIRIANPTPGQVVIRRQGRRAAKIIFK